MVYELAESEPTIPVIGIGMKAETSTDGIMNTVDYEDPHQRQQVIDSLFDLVRRFEVEYLLFGAEINRLAS